MMQASHPLEYTGVVVVRFTFLKLATDLWIVAAAQGKLGS